MLGIAVAEGRIASADDEAVKYFPEMMDVPEGRGPKPGRPAKSRTHVPGGFFRSTLAACWPKKEYGQRWQIETGFSMLKRLLGSALSSRRYQSLNAEVLLRVLTLNLMIFLRLLVKACFQHSKNLPFSPVCASGNCWTENAGPPSDGSRRRDSRLSRRWTALTSRRSRRSMKP